MVTFEMIHSFGYATNIYWMPTIHQAPTIQKNQWNNPIYCIKPSLTLALPYANSKLDVVFYPS